MGLKLILLVNIWLAMFAGLEGIGSEFFKEIEDLKAKEEIVAKEETERLKKDYETARVIAKGQITPKKGEKLVDLDVTSLTKSGNIYTATYIRTFDDGSRFGVWDECTLKYTNLHGKPVIKQAPVCDKRLKHHHKWNKHGKSENKK